MTLGVTHPQVKIMAQNPDNSNEITHISQKVKQMKWKEN
jgi:hypothetical protein